MSTQPRVLVIDDEASWQTTYCVIFADDGYALTSATSRAEALRHLGSSPWDLVVVDRRLQPANAPEEDGLDLLKEAQRLAPNAKVIVVTGYADSAAVDRAFHEGAWDFVEKNGYVANLLRIKVRHALEGTRERRLAALSSGHREQSIREQWAKALAEQNSQAKGALLEATLLLLFRSIEGFEDAVRNLETADEEFDVVITNQSQDPFWKNEGTYILVEAKNWTKTVGPDEFDRFVNKIGRRYGRSRLGFFVSVNGFTAGFKQHVAAERRQDALVVPLDRADIDTLIAAGPNRSEVLKRFHRRQAAGL